MNSAQELLSNTYSMSESPCVAARIAALAMAAGRSSVEGKRSVASPLRIKRRTAISFDQKTPPPIARYVAELCCSLLAPTQRVSITPASRLGDHKNDMTSESLDRPVAVHAPTRAAGSRATTLSACLAADSGDGTHQPRIRRRPWVVGVGTVVVGLFLIGFGTAISLIHDERIGSVVLIVAGAAVAVIALLCTDWTNPEDSTRVEQPNPVQLERSKGELTQAEETISNTATRPESDASQAAHAAPDPAPVVPSLPGHVASPTTRIETKGEARPQLTAPEPAADSLDDAPQDKPAPVVAQHSVTVETDRRTVSAGGSFTVRLRLDQASYDQAQAPLVRYAAVVVARPLGGGPRRTLAAGRGLLAPERLRIELSCVGLPPGSHRLEAVFELFDSSSSRPSTLLAGRHDGLITVINS